ncbi:AraC family transcriptional regulator [Vibrio hangzhouensis]|uniref:AraC family transcriptional regulator n=1 Tax=Vibrio hangzhouensis TaxID=462991 RepID=UPI001C9777E0|nr:AraC family transcriptional regulator [Vibrio hangzhouensis]MBY6196100.1 AraC family transcriptional regulator [Vibrio hangzhouensis]
MNHAIDFQSTHYQLLTITPRKKTLHNQLFRVESGKLLLKLGKNEYVYNAGDTFWLPFDCLSSLTVLPGSVLTTIKFSVRLHDNFPLQAGSVLLSPLATAILDRLQGNDNKTYEKELLQVLRQDAVAFRPKLQQDQESQMVSQWTPHSNAMTGELALVLRLREARKLKLSGTSTELICDKLFAGDIKQLQQLSLSLLGEPM